MEDNFSFFHSTPKENWGCIARGSKELLATQPQCAMGMKEVIIPSFLPLLLLRLALFEHTFILSNENGNVSHMQERQDRGKCIRIAPSLVYEAVAFVF